MATNRIAALLLTLSVAFVSTTAATCAKTPAKADWKEGKYAVVEVVDGDTVKVSVGKKTETVRILGVDTPEKYPTRTGYAECYGEEAGAFTVAAFSGKTVRIARDATQDARDKYGRALANVFLQDGSLYAEKAASAGTAFRYAYGGKPTAYDARIKKAEASAKKKGIGVWSACGGMRKPADSAWTPKIIPLPPATVPPVIAETATFSCSVRKSVCADMSSCEEAKFYLNSCGLGKLDRDKDGVPCETICN